jgi:hypothetical protein
MIEIELKYAVVLYAGILGGLAACVWLWAEWGARRTFHVLEKQHLWRCVFCGYSYLDEDAAQVSQCPRCESFNDATDEKAREVPGTVQPVDARVDENKQGSSRRKRPGQRRRGPRRRR